MSKEKVQDDKILLRLSTSLTSAMDQVIAEQLKELNRSEFIRRAIRFTIDNVEQFKTSGAVSISEKEDVEAVAKINAVRDLHRQVFEYKELLMKEPSTPNTIKQISFLIFLLAEMIFKISE